MHIRLDKLGDNNSYIELTQRGTWVEFGAGFPESARRAYVTGLAREDALALAFALRAMAESLLNPARHTNE